MYKLNRSVAAILSVMMMVATAPAFGRPDDDGAKANPPGTREQPREAGAAATGNGAVDAVEFIKHFKIGMSYSEVQAALPKTVEQDTLSYVTTDEAFVLNVEMPNTADWSASFRFDTQDAAIRRPERLIEMSCTTNLSSRQQSFEAVVGKVTAAFGEPVKVDRTGERIQQAGWRVAGSLLTLEYSLMPNGIGNNVTIEFTIRKSGRRAESRDDIA